MKAKTTMQIVDEYTTLKSPACDVNLFVHSQSKEWVSLDAIKKVVGKNGFDYPEAVFWQLMKEFKIKDGRKI